MAFLLFVSHPYHSLEIAAVNLGKKKKKKKGSRFEYCIITDTQNSVEAIIRSLLNSPGKCTAKRNWKLELKNLPL